MDLQMKGKNTFALYYGGAFAALISVIFSWKNIKSVAVFVITLFCLNGFVLKSYAATDITGSSRKTFYAIADLAHKSQTSKFIQSVIVMKNGSQQECDAALKIIKEGFSNPGRTTSMRLLSAECQREKTENISHLENWLPFVNAYVLKSKLSSTITMYMIVYHLPTSGKVNCDTLKSLFTKVSNRKKVACLPPQRN